MYHCLLKFSNILHCWHAHGLKHQPYYWMLIFNYMSEKLKVKYLSLVLWNMNQMDRTEKDELDCWSEFFASVDEKSDRCVIACSVYACMCLAIIELMVRSIYICRLLLWHCRFNIICIVLYIKSYIISYISYHVISYCV